MYSEVWVTCFVPLVYRRLFCTFKLSKVHNFMQDTRLGCLQDELAFAKKACHFLVLAYEFCKPHNHKARFLATCLIFGTKEECQYN